MKKFTLSLIALFTTGFLFSQTVSTFENLNLPADSFWNGADLSGGFTSGNAYFVNDYDTAFAAWSGFAYSNITDSAASGWGSQYNAITGAGYNGSATYAVADDFGNAKVLLTGNAAGKTVKGFYITNNTYAYYSMRDGDAFAKKFGGPTGADPDWFKVTARGWLNGTPTANQVEFYLADYRFADSTDYIVKDWQWFNLQPLGNVDSFQFYLSSSDTGQWGMNTPAYFCIDNFTTNDALNVAPIATNDDYYITYLQDTAFAVLSNDFDTTATPLTVTITSGPLIPGATATVDSNNRIRYTPATGIVATDTIGYSVCDAGGLCANARAVIRVAGLIGIEETEVAKATIYPNPFSDVLTIQTTEVFEKAELFDASGKVLRSVNLQLSKTIGTEELAAGVYFLKVSGAANVYTQRVIKN